MVGEPSHASYQKREPPSQRQKQTRPSIKQVHKACSNSARALQCFLPQDGWQVGDGLPATWRNGSEAGVSTLVVEEDMDAVVEAAALEVKMQAMQKHMCKHDIQSQNQPQQQHWSGMHQRCPVCDDTPHRHQDGVYRQAGQNLKSAQRFMIAQMSLQSLGDAMTQPSQEIATSVIDMQFGITIPEPELHKQRSLQTPTPPLVPCGMGDFNTSLSMVQPSIAQPATARWHMDLQQEDGRTSWADLSEDDQSSLSWSDQSDHRFGLPATMGATQQPQRQEQHQLRFARRVQGDSDEHPTAHQLQQQPGSWFQTTSAEHPMAQSMHGLLRKPPRPQQHGLQGNSFGTSPQRKSAQYCQGKPTQEGSSGGVFVAGIRADGTGQDVSLEETPKEPLKFISIGRTDGGLGDCSRETMKSQLQALEFEDPKRVMIVRRINTLGFYSADQLQAHFSKYGLVKKVHVAHSVVRSHPGNSRRTGWRLRAAALGFVVMDAADSVSRILAEGPQHDVCTATNTVTITVHSFKHRGSCDNTDTTRDGGHDIEDETHDMRDLSNMPEKETPSGEVDSRKQQLNSLCYQAYDSVIRDCISGMYPIPADRELHPGIQHAT